MKRIWLLSLLGILLYSCNIGNDPSGIHPGSSNSSKSDDKVQVIEYTVTQGQSLFNSDKATVRIDQEQNEFTILFKAKVADSAQIVSTHPDNTNANRLLTTIIASTDKHPAFATKLEHHFLSESEIVHQANFKLSDIRKLPEGMNSIRVKFQCETVQHDENERRKDRILGQPLFSVSILFQFNIPEIHKSTIHFKSLKLNEEATNEKLKNNRNDLLNGTPEAGIKIFYKDNLIFKGFSHNSYTHTKKQSIDFYHVSDSDILTFKAVDVDYGLNMDDYISHTQMSIKKLLIPKHENFPFESVDEFWVYCTTKGQVN